MVKVSQMGELEGRGDSEPSFLPVKYNPPALLVPTKALNLVYKISEVLSIRVLYLCSYLYL
jgi:hypothetical protein